MNRVEARQASLNDSFSDAFFYCTFLGSQNETTRRGAYLACFFSKILERYGV